MEESVPQMESVSFPSRVARRGRQSVPTRTPYQRPKDDKSFISTFREKVGSWKTWLFGAPEERIENTKFGEEPSGSPEEQKVLSQVPSFPTPSMKPIQPTTPRQDTAMTAASPPKAETPQISKPSFKTLKIANELQKETTKPQNNSLSHEEPIHSFSTRSETLVPTTQVIPSPSPFLPPQSPSFFPERVPERPATGTPFMLQRRTPIMRPPVDLSQKPLRANPLWLTPAQQLEKEKVATKETSTSATVQSGPRTPRSKRERIEEEAESHKYTPGPSVIDTDDHHYNKKRAMQATSEVLAWKTPKSETAEKILSTLNQVASPLVDPRRKLNGPISYRHQFAGFKKPLQSPLRPPPTPPARTRLGLGGAKEDLPPTETLTTTESKPLRRTTPYERKQPVRLGNKAEGNHGKDVERKMLPEIPSDGFEEETHELNNQLKSVPSFPPSTPSNFQISIPRSSDQVDGKNTSTIQETAQKKNTTTDSSIETDKPSFKKPLEVQPPQDKASSDTSNGFMPSVSSTNGDKKREETKEAPLPFSFKATVEPSSLPPIAVLEEFKAPKKVEELKQEEVVKPKPSFSFLTADSSLTTLSSAKTTEQDKEIEKPFSFTSASTSVLKNDDKVAEKKDSDNAKEASSAFSFDVKPPTASSSASLFSSSALSGKSTIFSSTFKQSESAPPASSAVPSFSFVSTSTTNTTNAATTSSATEEWACACCETKNPGSSNTCSVCLVSKPKPTTTKTPPASSSSASSSSAPAFSFISPSISPPSSSSPSFVFPSSTSTSFSSTSVSSSTTTGGFSFTDTVTPSIASPSLTLTTFGSTPSVSDKTDATPTESSKPLFSSTALEAKGKDDTTSPSDSSKPFSFGGTPFASSTSFTSFTFPSSTVDSSAATSSTPKTAESSAPASSLFSSLSAPSTSATSLSSSGSSTPLFSFGATPSTPSFATDSKPATSISFSLSSSTQSASSETVSSSSSTPSSSSLTSSASSFPSLFSSTPASSSSFSFFSASSSSSTTTPTSTNTTSSTTSTAPSVSSAFSFSIPTTKPSFTFGKAEDAKPTVQQEMMMDEKPSHATTTPAFSFGSSSAPSTTPSFSFGKNTGTTGFSFTATPSSSAPSSTSAPAPSSAASSTPFSFGAATNQSFVSPSPSPLPSAPSSPFTFGGSSSSNNIFSSTPSASPASSPASAPFSSSSTIFNFASTAAPATTSPSPSFTFGASPSTPTPSPSSGFNFGAPSASNLSFAPSTPPASSSSFMFNASAAPSAAPSTPGFSFGAPNSFGIGAPPAAASNGFSFGSPALSNSGSALGFGEAGGFTVGAGEKRKIVKPRKSKGKKD